MRLCQRPSPSNEEARLGHHQSCLEEDGPAPAPVLLRDFRVRLHARRGPQAVADRSQHQPLLRAVIALPRQAHSSHDRKLD